MTGTGGRWFSSESRTSGATHGAILLSTPGSVGFRRLV